jgi:pimeloyl-ACP methyl ester carboxylesterase
MVKRFLSGAVWLSALHASMAFAVDTSCQLKYPIVLSHHWGARPICPDPALTGPKACVTVEDYDRLCVAKGVDATGRRTCGEWRVPAEDADLPPRDTNVVDPTLKRSLMGFHRYFSRTIVDRLVQTCGNKVYLADKPVYASYEERARSMRHTVLQALAETGAAKVILIGVSQGSQDARFLAAALPVDDNDARKGQMKDKVAAVVTLVGEDKGAESASIQLDVLFFNNGGNWTDYLKTGGLWSDEAAKHLYWTRTVNGRLQYVLGENCKGADCDLMTPEQRYAWGLHSLANLSTRYMRPNILQTLFAFSWNDLKSATGMKHDRWDEQIPSWKEALNGVKYYSYAMAVQNINEGIDRPELFYGIFLLAGKNDGYVSVDSQKLDNPAPNFEHIKTLSGALFGTGYHHMFATGRNDKLYQPLATHREGPPYQGDSASFYQQIARDLKARGH